jgi:hypothetical protein
MYNSRIKNINQSHCATKRQIKHKHINQNLNFRRVIQIKSEQKIKQINKLKKKKKKKPVSNMPEELVGAEVLDFDIDQLAAAAIHGVAAHLLELGELPVVAGLTHVDGEPHRRFLAEFAPRRAHPLRARQDLDGAQSQQDRRRQVSGQLQPVGEVVCRVRRRVHL